MNELAIENLSADADVFIQGGDIVKGGQQDRVFATDLILPPKSGKTRIESFCVEQGRWSRRGAEDFRTFSASANMVVSNDVKLAIKGSKNQGEVWNSVARLREKLAPRVSMARGVAAASPTSMQLYLEDGAVNKGADEHAASLLKAGEGAPDAVGYVFALNGKILSADIYASPALFRELWPKHAQALAIEALAEQDKSGASVRLTSEAALAFLYGAESGGTTSSPAPAAPNSRTRVVKKDSAKALYLESHDNASKGWIHRSYTAK